MPIPDRIERTIDLAQSPQRVWEALTSAEGLGRWFGDHRSTRRWALPGFRSPRTVRTIKEDV
jgi:uncharacterized protein YndB with AHSA1/START domain